MKQTIKSRERSYYRAGALNLSAGMNGEVDTRVLSFSEAEAAYNVCLTSGAIKNGYGAEQTDIPSCYDKVFLYIYYNEELSKDEYRKIAHGIDGKIYALTNGEFSEIGGAEFSSVPMGVNYRLYGEDVFLLCGKEGMCVIKSDLTSVAVPSAPQITSLAMHNERMFVTIGGRKNAVWFSDDLDPTNWNPELDEGGYIELEGERGRLNKALSFGGYVYIFRDYGISRLTAYAEQSDFSVTNLFVSSGRIYADTVAVCGDRIIFMADDGLYVFDGITASKICKRLNGIIKPSATATACYLGGKYYLAAGQSGESNDVLAVIDPQSYSACISKGISVQSFSPLVSAEGEALLIKADGEEFLGKVTVCGSFYGVSSVKEWKSGFSDLGYPDKRKLITYVCIDSEYDCTLTVRTEKREKTFFIKGKKEVNKKRVNLTGVKVQVEIIAEGDISVARPTLLFCNVK